MSGATSLSPASKATRSSSLIARKPSILFVDDESHVLEGLRRSLRGMRNVWDLEFVTSGASALRKLRARPFDLLVTDLRMPEMDGLELLAAVARYHPSVRGIILTGTSDRDVASRGRRMVRDYLLKPCDRDLLKAVIEMRLSIDGRLRPAELAALVGSSGYSSRARSLMDVNGTIERTIATAQTEWMGVAEVVTELDPTLRPIPGSAGDLRLLLLNMLVSGAHLLVQLSDPRGPMGTLRIRTQDRGSVVELRVEEEPPAGVDGATLTPPPGWGGDVEPWLAYGEDLVAALGGTFAVEPLHRGGRAFTVVLPSF